MCGGGGGREVRVSEKKGGKGFVFECGSGWGEVGDK